MNCKYCNSPVDYFPKVFANGTQHMEKKCLSCGRSNGFERTVPDSEFLIPFGKYKGQLLGGVLLKDPSYLLWLRTVAKPSLKRRIDTAFNIDDEQPKETSKCLMNPSKSTLSVEQLTLLD